MHTFFCFHVITLTRKGFSHHHVLKKGGRNMATDSGVAGSRPLLDMTTPGAEFTPPTTQYGIPYQYGIISTAIQTWCDSGVTP